jgi:hypothetical protein
MDDGNAIEAGRPTGIVVLGMHRSGTSALARILSLVGADLPRDLLEPSESNVTGHWEAKSVLRLHVDLFGALHTNWHDWLAIDAGQFNSGDCARFVEAARQYLIRDFGRSRLFVLKDPRMCRLVPLWTRIFERTDMTMRAVLPLRHPLEVAQSLLDRNAIPIEHGLMMWLRHVLDAEAGSRGVTRSWTTYGGLIDDWRGTVGKIGRELGVAWPRFNAEAADTFLDPSLRHHSDARLAWPKTAVSDLAEDAHAVLSEFTERGETAEGRDALDRLRAAFDRDTAANVVPAAVGQPG